MLKQRPTTAVIAVAGYGTRMLPITKAIEKCMLPVLNRPVIDYIVQDCADAGITKIIFVVSDQHEQLKRYYGQNTKLNDYLHKKGKDKQLDDINSIGGGITFEYIVQSANQKYGTAIPLMLAKDKLASEENFIYLMGDDFFFYKDKPSTLKLIEDWGKASDKHALIGAKKPEQELFRYGVLETDKAGRFKSIIEKPRAGEAPSNYVSVARYLLNRSIFNFLDMVTESESGEYHITDAINLAVKAGEGVIVSRNNDEWLDCGNPEGWLYANNRLSKNQ